MTAPHRRDFVKAATLAALAPLAEGPAAAQPVPPATIAATADALTEAARLQFGSYLDMRQLEQVRQAILRSQMMARRMVEVPLRNGDEPAFIFQPEVPG